MNRNAIKGKKILSRPKKCNKLEKQRAEFRCALNTFLSSCPGKMPASQINSFFLELRTQLKELCLLVNLINKISPNLKKS